MQDLLRAEEEARALLAPVLQARPDLLILTDIDHDADLAALRALQDMLARDGHDLPHRFGLRPNTGMPTGRDLDGDGRLGGPGDAQGFGWFSGQGGMAVLSRWPLDAARAQDLSGLLWKDLPGSRIAADDPGHDIQRLSSAGHWLVPVQAPVSLTLLVFHATPPVFDGPEDRNGRRNADEIALWRHLLDGRLPVPPPDGAVILAGNANLDPERGAGLRADIAALLAHPRLQDTAPTGPKGTATAQWPPPGPGALRVQYLLPSRDLMVTGSGQIWPEAPGAAHGLIWIDVTPRR